MRRLTRLIQAVLSSIAATAARIRARFTPVRATVPATPARGTRRIRRLHAVPLVAVLAIGATAFATGASSSDGAERIAVGDQVPHDVGTTTTEAPTTTAAPTTTTAPPTTQAPVTTAPPPPPTTEAPPPPTTAPPAPVQVSGACGGDLPPCCVMMRESGGDPTAVNPSSGASGKWQFMPGTWANYGGYATAASAPEWVQDEKAAQLWAGGAGAGHWGGGCW